MDEVPTRKHAEAHAKAVVEGDMDSVANDLIPDLRGQLNDIAGKLPDPTTDAEVTKLDMEDDHAIVETLYSNEDEKVRLRSRWEEIDERPMIVEVNQVED